MFHYRHYDHMKLWYSSPLHDYLQRYGLLFSDQRPCFMWMLLSHQVEKNFLSYSLCSLHLGNILSGRPFGGWDPQNKRDTPMHPRANEKGPVVGPRLGMGGGWRWLGPYLSIHVCICSGMIYSFVVLWQRIHVFFRVLVWHTQHKLRNARSTPERQTFLMLDFNFI